MDENFLRSEKRCGFEVSEMMKRVWAGEIKILSEVIKICKKNQIPYYADYGTLLGAVRHGGFVPWDDDIDISLKRPDYMRLIQILKEELHSPYVIQSCYIGNEHNQPMTSVSNGTHIPLDQSTQKCFFDCPYVIGIDIYALDYIPDDKELAEGQLAMYNVVYDMAQRFNEMKENGELEKYLPQVEEICGTKLIHDNTLRGQLWRLTDQIAAMFTENEGKYLTYFPRVVQGSYDFKLSKEWFQSVEQRKFEYIQIDIPKGYDGVLKQLYGAYQICEQGGSSHEYPFYRNQKEFLDSIGLKYEL